MRFCLAALLCFLFSLSYGQEMGSPVNNIILITLDDLGNQVGFLGDSNAVTPNLDLLAQESVVFTNAYASQSSCSPSRASILT